MYKIICKEYVCVIFNLLGSSQYLEDLLGPRASKQQITNHSRIYLLTRSKNAQEVATTSIKTIVQLGVVVISLTTNHLNITYEAYDANNNNKMPSLTTNYLL